MDNMVIVLVVVAVVAVVFVGLIVLIPYLVKKGINVSGVLTGRQPFLTPRIMWSIPCKSSSPKFP